MVLDKLQPSSVIRDMNMQVTSEADFCSLRKGNPCCTLQPIYFNNHGLSRLTNMDNDLIINLFSPKNKILRDTIKGQI